jgi:hypothetical protein
MEEMDAFGSRRASTLRDGVCVPLVSYGVAPHWGLWID